MSDIVIKPGLVSRNPFFVSKKAAEFKQMFIYRGDEEFLHVEFPMATPWLYALPQQFTLEPGAKSFAEVRIYVQPLHPAFPKDKNVEAEVRVSCRTPSGKRVLQIPVYLHDIQPIKDFEGVLAIDFGTSSSCVSYIEHHDGQAAVRTVAFLEDGSGPTHESVGSMIYFADHGNPVSPEYEIGQSAVLAWRGSGRGVEDAGGAQGEASGPSDDAPLSAFKYSVKRYLGTGKKTYVLNNRVNPQAKPVFYDYEQLSGFVIQRILSTAEDVLGRRITKVVATYPTTFTTTQLEALQRVFKNLGFQGDALNLAYDEANASTLSYFYDALSNNSVLVLKAIFPPPSFILTFDFGGGTLDITVIRVEIKEAGPTHEIATRIEGVAGARHFGGDNVSLVFYKLLKAKLALYIAEAGVEPTGVADPDAYRQNLDLLRDRADDVRRLIADGRPLGAELEGLIESVLPTRYDPTGEGGDEPRRRFFEIWEKAEAIKKRFGTPDASGKYPETVPLAADFGLVHVSDFCGVSFLGVDDIEFRAAEWEAHVKGPIRDAIEKAKRLVPHGEPVALAILSGNSSRLPIVRRQVQEALGLSDQNIHFDPNGCKIAVAKGAAFARRNELVPTRIKYKIGNLLTSLPWDVGCRVGGAPFECFFERGTDLPTNTPYVFEPPTDASLLHILKRLSPQDEAPEEIGYFDFSRPPSGRPTPPDVQKAVKAGQARKRQKTLGRRKGDLDPPAGKPITVWIDRDRQVFAEKDGKSYALNYQPEDFPPEVDPFSGIH